MFLKASLCLLPTKHHINNFSHVCWMTVIFSIYNAISFTDIKLKGELLLNQAITAYEPLGLNCF